jgi:hypothetical protein
MGFRHQLRPPARAALRRAAYSRAMHGLRIVVLAIAVVAGVSVAIAIAAPSRLIQANATMQRLGDWRIDKAPSLGAAKQAFGQPTRCHAISLESGSIARWSTLGIRIVTATLGGIPPGKTSCSYSDMPVSVVTVTGRAWQTSLGLRVGDPTRKLRHLYPTASFHAASRGDASPRSSYWLVTRRAFCFGDCAGTRYVTTPQLVAQTRAGKVVALIFPVGAQGE